MDRHDHIAARQRAQRLNELIRRVKALRCVAKPQRHAQRAVGERLFQPQVERFHRLRRQHGAAKARHARTQRPAADQHSQIQRQRLFFERRQVLPHALRAHRLRQRAGHRIKIVQDLRAVCLAARRDRQPAVSVYDRRQPLSQLRAPKARAKRCRVGVTVDVEKAGRQAAALRVDALRGSLAVQPPERGDLSVFDAEAARNARPAASVDQKRIFNSIVQHSFASFQEYSSASAQTMQALSAPAEDSRRRRLPGGASEYYLLGPTALVRPPERISVFPVRSACVRSRPVPLQRW